MIDTSVVLTTFTAIYLMIGFLLATIGPAGKTISNEIKRVGNPLIYEFRKENPPSTLKIILLRTLLTVGMILLWPLLIWDVIKEKRLQVEIEKNRIEKSTGLWFQNMGGCGSIHCLDCQHTENVTSFIHGIDSSHSGFQCQGCGMIASLTGGGRGKANQYKEIMNCECGGKFEREMMLFCPRCKSKNLFYAMKYIT